MEGDLEPLVAFGPPEADEATAEVDVAGREQPDARVPGAGRLEDRHDGAIALIERCLAGTAPLAGAEVVECGACRRGELTR
jgi:hypothetical protein